MLPKDPIAIIGIGCRFPGGANTPGAFWRLLSEGVDAVREVPPDRWNPAAYYDPKPGQKGKTVARWGGFLDAIDLFDAGFFGLSPREAAFMDPQQRLLLQTAWEALEDGGVAINPAEASPAGVFIGICTNDYSLLQSTPEDLSTIDPYTATGTAASIAANRISYCLNLRGPSCIVDTACSSSLVALHLACTSLWTGECPLALAGGVNVIIGVSPFISFSRSSMLSPDGRCKAFDAAANGFVRGEGAGVVALKPLHAALADGNPIYAVIRATAVNQDGRTNGITVPNGEAQAALVREACRQARIETTAIQYVEAHGTGTPVGDPIEAQALGAALGTDRTGPACVIGSVKTNIGHLEAGAGVAGVIKVALALHHGQIPPSLHFRRPSPHIDFARWKLRVAQSLEPFRNGDEWPTAGINSFGFGGTNAHAILQAAPAAGPRKRSIPSSAPAPASLLTLSARSPEALRAMAQTYQAVLGAGGEEAPAVNDLCYTAGAHRTHHAHRLAIVGPHRAALAEALGAFLAGESRPGLSAGEVVADPAPVFVCSGQGPQWWAMGRELLRDEPVFRAKMEECDRLLREFGDWSLLEELARSEQSTRLHETGIAQPAIFALQVALAAVWEAWGIRPAAIVGHSVGETAAAHLAGVLSLREAARVIFHRGRCMEVAAGQGRMLAAALSWDEADALIAPCRDRVAIGAWNGPHSVTLSGDGPALETIAAELNRRGIKADFLRVNYAFHSPQMELARADLLQSLGRVDVRPAAVPLFSTVSGTAAIAADFDADYWWRNVRQTVRFAAAIDGLLERGHRRFLELSPHPVLGGPILECLRQRGLKGTITASLRRKEAERATMLGALGTLHTLGCAVNWRAVYPGAAVVRLPAYAWQQEHFWNEAEELHTARLNPAVHPLLGQAVRTADPTWQTRVDLEILPYLKDHRVQNRPVFPAAGYIEMAFGAARAWSGATPCVIEDLDFLKALNLAEGDEASRVQFSHGSQEGSFTISSRPAGEAQPWTTHAVGRIRPAAGDPPRIATSLAAAQKACRETVPVDLFYQAFREVGIGYGPTFRGVEALWRTEYAALGRVRLPPTIAADAANYQFHPALLDACLQVLVASVPVVVGAGRRACFLPVRIARLRFFGRPGPAGWCHARLTRGSGRMISGDSCIFDDEGRPLLLIEGLTAQAVVANRSGPADELQDALYDVHWKPRPWATAAGSGTELAPLPAIIARVEKLARELAAEVRVRVRTDLRQAEQAIEDLSRHYILAAGAQLGWQLRPGEHVTLEDRIAQLGIAPKHRRVFLRQLELLERGGLLRREGDGWKVRRAGRPVDTDAFWQRTLARFPRVLPELSLLRRCGRELAGVWQDKVDPLKLIFPEGSLAAAEHFYQDSESCRNTNRLVAEAVAAAVSRLPEGRVVRILEIGAGTGGLTSYVLPRLPRERTEYVFSDLSSMFFAKAEQKFFDYPFLHYQLLDIDRSPAEQGFAPHSFDLVLASDAIHASRDLGATLGHVRSLLAPQGLLALLEVDRTPRWVDLVFALTEGWWRFTDTDRRPDYPLLERERWLALLSECGYTGARGISDQGEEAICRQSVFLAGAPAAAMAPVVAGPAVLPVPGIWLLFADRGGLATRLAAGLTARGDSPILVRPGKKFARKTADLFEVRADSPDDLRQVLAELRGAGGAPIAGVVHAWNLDATNENLTVAETLGCHSVLHLVQALTQEAAVDVPRLWIVTRGAQAVERGEVVAVAQAPAWGLGRVIGSERPKFRCRLVDLTPGGTPDEAATLLQELEAADNEDEVAHRGSARYVGRIARTSLEQQVQASHGSGTKGSFRLEVSVPGALDRLVLRTHRRRPPAAGEVEIAVKAAALNFRDVLKTLGIYPTEDERDHLLGDECSGVIVRVGRGVKGLRRGDKVIVLARGSFSSHLTTRADRVLRKPERLYFDEAATLPVAFLTAWYALHHLGRIRRGDRVLIQAATGGVGLAAIQVARLAGAEIFATAGSPEKREFLRALGIRHVMDSRTLAFADEIREYTNGRGVDLVLNSLSGEAIAKGIASLAPNGRFLEIGKRDVYQNTKLGLRPFRNNVALFVIDLAQIMEHDPALVASMLRRIMAHVEAGRFHPLPLRTFQVSQAVNAFRHMSQARHLGKVVLGFEHDPAVPVRAVDLRPMHFRPEASYLITGGLGGFGLAVAEWMVRSGARHLVLASRSGAATEEARRAVARLQQLGAEVLTPKVDVSAPRAVARLLRSIARRRAPLRGIFHAAMVLDDGALAQLNAARFRRVMAPKADGAWHLHRACAGLPLDCFVLFSSISGLVGSAGQANYAAANGFLEALARHRHALGLPALVVSWGVISEVGYVSRNAKVEEYLRHHGLLGIKPTEATGLLGRMLRNGTTHLGVFPVDWHKWTAHTPTAAASRRYEDVIATATVEGPGENSGAREALLNLPPAERLPALTAQLKGLIAKVLRTSAAKLDPSRPLNELGLDSLMSIELLERIEGHFASAIPAGNLSAGTTIAKMAGDLLVVLGGAAPGVPAGEAPPPAAAPAPVDCRVTLRPGGARPPLFCIHPAGGLVNIYDALAQRLDGDRPVIGLQSRALKTGVAEHGSLGALAADYAHLIRERQPQGPYHLLGFSIGGLLALAVARALEADGQDVALVGLIDAEPRLADPEFLRTTFLRPFIATLYGTLARETPLLQPLPATALQDLATHLAATLAAQPAETWPATIQQWFADRGTITPRMPAGLLTLYLTLFCHHARLVQGFQPVPLHAPLAVWHASEANRAAATWSRFTRTTVTENVVGGEHYDLLYPPLVETLAGQLATVLAPLPHR